MANLIEKGVIVASAGGKRIEELIGRIASGTASISIARMRCPSGWTEPGQVPAFDEYTLVIRGTLLVETRNSVLEVGAGEAAAVPQNEWVRYSAPGNEGAEYIAICVPAFSPETAHRDET